MTKTDSELYWAHQVRNAIPVGARKLCVFRLKGRNYDLFESYEVSDLLGYKQHSSLRKQTLTDWKGLLDELADFVVIRNPEVLQSYDELYARVHAVELKPVHPTRGRLFFTLDGLVKVLRKTSKPTSELEAALRNKYDGVNWNPDVKTTSTPSPAPQSLEDRKFEYEVVQTLIQQLERLQNPQLRSLAITAAETALGRRLDEVRTGEALNNVFTATASTPRREPVKPTLEVTTTTTHPARVVVDGPTFTKNDFYSMTRIGEKAGGYSAKQAGQAADIVAKRFGYTREQIRNEELPINQLAMRPDTTTGRKRQMVRFHTKFANQVVLELRQNPDFVPEFTPSGIPTFESNEGYPTLSRGPLDEQA